MRVIARATGSVAISELAAGGAAAVRRGVAAADEAVLPPEFQSDRVSVEKTYAVSVDPAAPVRRGDELPVIEFDVEAAGDEASLVVLRHPSGAITFHPGETATVRGAGAKRGAAASRITHFRIPLRRAHTAEGRRGLITQVVKAAVLKVSKPVADAATSFLLPKLARLWEERTWSRHGLSEGWFRVIPPPAAGALQLEPATPQPGNRSLLLLHGTFSDAASAYRGLTRTEFFKHAASIYENRVFAFNHFTVSRSPQENAEALLGALPPGRCQFDVVTHSRGGLVLRTLVERPAELGPKASRFQLGRAVLVASPNDGTPLATPDRWDKTIGWIANLLKIIDRFSPENPLLTGAEFVAEGIVWLAHHVAGDLPGLRAMDGAGEIIEGLQGPPAPPLQSYSALVANFHPTGNIAQVMADAGVDQFFGSANDLVVPSEGGWRVDRDGVQHVNAAAVGCFGPGGNLATAEPSAVIHTNFFDRRETATFLLRALAGEDQQLPTVNLNAPLPDRRFIRGAAGALPAPVTGPQRGRGAGPLEAPAVAFNAPTTAARDTFHVVIIEVPAAEASQPEPGAAEQPAGRRAARPRPRALIYAAYGGARVVEEFALRDGSAGKNWQRIIALHQRIKAATDLQQGAMPSEAQMDELG
ncbi:MAG TPA: hypothetical protein VFL57_07460, partial [Bryobacteraceae bacterium]|nr:hypothetical protein [Bryobacteraceae bacterium]